MCYKDQFWWLYFNIFLNDFYFFRAKAPLHNYTVDNTSSTYSSDLHSLIDILIEESRSTINWIKANHMIVNPKKLRAMLLSKRKNTITGDLTISINDADIKPNNSVKLIVITLNNKLNFEKHISSICKSASCHLNAPFSLKNFLGFKERKILTESFVYSNFNYCPLIWHFCNKKSSQKVENLQQKRALQFLQNDYTSSYDDLLENSNKSTMKIQRLRTLCLEIVKTLDQLNPCFMSNIFDVK